MIFPFLSGFLSFDKAPFTWVLVLLNFVLFFSFSDTAKIEKEVQKYIVQDNLLSTGIYYEQYLKQMSDKSVVQDPLILKLLKNKSSESYQVLGSIGMRDPIFLSSLNKLTFVGDPVAIQKWKQTLTDFYQKMTARNLNIFGLSSEQNNWKTWVTYQFMHGSFLHLLSNMVILLLFGCAIEATLGGYFVLAIYLLGGFAGASFFLKMSGLTSAPMVGASGAVSALIAFYALNEKRKKIQYAYFISPFEGYYGFVHMPTWLIFPICFLSDISGYLTTPIDLGGVAFAAHIGGAIFGVSSYYILKPTLSFFKLHFN